MPQLVQSKEYHGAALKAVLQHSAAPKGSLYFHFPGGKSELGRAAVALTAEHFKLSITQAMAVTDSFDELVDVVVSGLTEMLLGSDYSAGCPIAAITLDAGTEDELLRTACSDAYASWVATFQAYLAPFAGETRDTLSLAT